MARPCQCDLELINAPGGAQALQTHSCSEGTHLEEEDTRLPRQPRATARLATSGAARSSSPTAARSLPPPQPRAMSSGQQVRPAAPPRPHQSSPTATVPGTPSQASSPCTPSSTSSPQTSGPASSPRTPGTPGLAGSPRTPGTPGSERVASPLECSICFVAYDNAFKTPKQLSCAHVFCLECLARLAAAQPTSRPGSEAVPCPFCRQPTAMPAAGAPALRTSRQLQARMPVHLQREAPVWLEGTKLCCRPPAPAPGLVSVEVGLSKPPEAPAPLPGPGPARRPQGCLARCRACCRARCGDWRRMTLVVALLLVLFCVALWPVQCAFRTGSLRCLPRAPPAAPAPVAPAEPALPLGVLATL